MPIQADPTPASPVAATGGAVAAGPTAPTPTEKPPLRTTTGSSGTMRFKDLLDGIKGMSQEDQDKYVLSLPVNDASDPEYVKLLKAAQETALTRTAKGKTVGAIRLNGSPATVQPATAAQTKASTAINAKLTAMDQAQYRTQIQQQPIIKGMGVDASMSYTSDDIDGLLYQFATGQDLQYDGATGPAKAQLAIKSGDYVYAGQVADEAGGKGFTRASYAYKDDAQAMLAGMDPNKVKAYQKQLGLPESGIADAALQGEWNKAVTAAQYYARAGKKVDLNFIFDQIIAADVASGGLGRGGGSSVPLTDNDYYFSMMQVLGDISGVK